MKFEKYLITESVLDSALKSIRGKSVNAVKKIFRDSWEKLVNILKDEGLEKDALRIINRHTGGSFKSLDTISKKRIQEDTQLNEDFAHWWKWLKENAWASGAIFSSLQIFFELDKLLGGTDLSMRRLLIYAGIWASLVSGKYIKDWIKWSRENPEEKEKEQKERKKKKGFERIKHAFRSI